MRGLLSLVLLAILWPAGVHASVQNPQCFPQGPHAQQWPVKAVYLHGLFTASGADTNGFRALEAGNRRKIEELANRLRIRIAVPVAPVGRNRMRNWNTTTLPQIESAAARACGISALDKPRALIGFSNGGYKARQVALLPCAQTQDYLKILAIGAPNNTRDGACRGQLVNRAPHVMPGMDFFETHLSTLRNPNGAPTPPETVPPIVR